MDRSEANLDRIEAQRSMEDQRKPRYFPMNLINNRTRTSRGFLEEETPPTREFLTSLRLSDLFDVPGEYVSMNPEIFSAMRSGNREFLKKLISYTTPVACFKNVKGDSILHLAAAWGHLELVKNIVSKSPCLLVELNFKDRLPLHVAARAGHSAVVKALLESIAYFSAKLSEEDREGLNLYTLKDIHGATAQHLALKGCHMVIAACLVDVNRDASFLANKDGKSPLYMAVEAGDVSLVKEMLNRPSNRGQASNLASQLEGKKSLVHAALKAKNTDILDVILNNDPSLVNEQDEEGRTCLSVGASLGYYQGVCNLLDRSTSSIFESDDDGSFPIHRAVEEGHEDIVEEILKRCPDSRELLNKKGQNILHIAAKSGKLVLYIRIIIDKKKNNLIKEKDVDGNTPLHLATVNWRPRTILYLVTCGSINEGLNLVTSGSSKTGIFHIHNKDGLRPLDIAELNLKSEYIFRERMTLMLLLCFYAPKGVGVLPTSGMTLRSRSEDPNTNKYKDHINVLLLVATLIATITFTAGFTLPGGFNSSAPNLGMSILANDHTFSSFLIFDTLAMQSSIVAIVALIWAQLGDRDLAHRAFNLALPLLLYSLVFMSLAFTCGVHATIKHNSSLLNGMWAIYIIFYCLMIFLLAPYAIHQVPNIRMLQVLFMNYLILLVLFVNEDDGDNCYTSGTDHKRVKKVESVVPLSTDQVEKSKVI